jgi:hypothetical protein
MNLKRIAWIAIVVIVCSLLVCKFSSKETPKEINEDDKKKV